MSILFKYVAEDEIPQYESQGWELVSFVKAYNLNDLSFLMKKDV